MEVGKFRSVHRKHQSNLRKALTRYMKSTHFHGLSELTESSPLPIKIIWASCLLAAVGYCSYLIYEIVAHYAENPTHMKSTFERIESLPDVWLLPVNSLNRTKMRESGITPEMQEKLEFMVQSSGLSLLEKVWAKTYAEVRNVTGKSAEERYLSLLPQNGMGAIQHLSTLSSDILGLEGPFHFKDFVLKYALPHDQLISTDHQTTSSMKVHDGGIWYGVGLPKLEQYGFSMPVKICFYRQPDVDESEIEAGVLKFDHSEEAHKVFYNHVNDIRVQLTRKRYITNCTTNEEESLSKAETCLNHALQDRFNCCDCSRKLVGCSPNTTLCCDFFHLQQLRSKFEECGNMRVRPCNTYIFNPQISTKRMSNITLRDRFYTRTYSMCIILRYVDVESSIVFYETHSFEFSSALSSIGGILGLFIGGSVISLLHVCYFWIMYRFS